MKKLLFLSAFMLCVIAVFAQSRWYKADIRFGRHINSVAILGFDKLIIAGGNEFNDSIQVLLFSGNQGFEWQINPSDDISAWIKSIDFADSLRGIGVGSSGKMVRTIDGGHTWAKMSTPVINTRHFNKVFFVDSLLGFVAGGLQHSMQTIMKSTDGGNTWTIVYDQQGEWLRSIHFVNASTGFAVGDSGTILKTANGGTAWTPVMAPVLRDFNSLAFINDTTGYIVGGDEGDSMRTMLQTTNGGLNWTPLKDEPGGWLTDIYFLNPTTGYIVGDVATLWKTTTGGQSWTPETVHSASADDHFTSIRFLDQNFGVIGGLFGAVHVYTTSALPEATTFGATLIDPATVTLSAVLNTHGYPGKYTFWATSDTAAFSPGYPNYTTTDAPAIVNYTIPLLSPNTTYSYFIKATTFAGSVSGDTLSFYTDGSSYQFRTTPASNVTSNSATLGGFVNKLPSLTNISFEYDTTPVFGHAIPANLAVVNDTLYHIVTAQVTSLIPDKVYFYRLKGTSAGGNYYGNVMNFFSGDVFADLRTLAATDPTDSSAVMNGIVNKLKIPATLSFQYDTVPSFGNSIQASPSFVNDTLLHQVSAVIGNLKPYKVYYFRLRAQTTIGDFYGQAVTYANGNLFSNFQTLPANVLGLSAVLNGLADSMQVPVTLSFEYGTGGQFSNSIPALPNQVSDSLRHAVTASLDNLLPYTTYTFRLKGQTTLGDFYGISYAFATGGPFAAFVTKTATNVTANSATLNGVVEKINGALTLGFDYGTTTAFGNYIGATPDSVSDTLRHDVSADLTGLATDVLYYYRMKGADTNGGIFYGDTVQLFTGTSTIPNWDFQHWSTETMEHPVEWNIIKETFSRVPGRTGSALKISGSNVAVLGVIGEGLFGGQAFNARPDSFTCYLNYRIDAGDTAFFAAVLFKGSSIVSENFYPVTGSSGGQFEKLTYALNYQSADMPDSLAVVFVSSNAFLDGAVHPHPDNYMIADDIGFQPSTAPAVLNGNFEQWFDNHVDRPLQWYYPGFIYIDSTGLTQYISQVLFSAPDDYALEVSNVNYKGQILGLEVANYYKVFWDGKHGTPVHARHQTFNGYYRYFPDNADTMEIRVALYNNGVEIGNGRFSQYDPVPDFTPFEVPLLYFDSIAVPDSIEISCRPSAGRAYGLSTLAIDKLTLDGLVNGVEFIAPPSSAGDGIHIFPNPASDVVTIELQKDSEGVVQIFNLAGKMLYTSEFNKERIEVNTMEFSKGLYVVRILQEGKRLTDKFVVIR